MVPRTLVSLMVITLSTKYTLFKTLSFSGQILIKFKLR